MLKENKKYNLIIIRKNTNMKDYSQPCVIFPTYLFDQLNLREDSYIRFNVGTKNTLLRVKKGNDKVYLSLSKESMEKLCLYENLQVGLLWEENSIKLGPVIGVFVSNGAINGIARGEPSFRIVELMKNNKDENTLLYCFSIKDINWVDQTISGYIYRYDINQWEKRPLPFPDVLYDRGGGFLPNQKPIARYIRKQFENLPNIKKLNSQHYFDKWDVHLKLTKYNLNCLPETILYSNNNSIPEMLNKYKVLYLKSCSGSNGREVMRVIKKDLESYNISYYRDELYSRDVVGLNDLINEIQKFFDKRKFIIQQGIEIITYLGENVDIRVLCQRDEQGKWKIVDFPVRIASEKSPITSTKSGSKVFEFTKAFELFGFDNIAIKSLKEDLSKLVNDIILAIEQEYGTFGEIGIDVALDKQGNLWFLEANAKPGKDTVFLTNDIEACKKAFSLPLKYLKYLADFSK